MIEFFMPMNPPTKTHQTKRVRMGKNGKPIFYEDAELKAVREKLSSFVGVHRPPKPFEKGVRLITKWCFYKGSKHQDGEYKLTKPDTDNLQKLLKDVMTTNNFWLDDCLVVSEITEKFWSAVPGIYIKIEEV